MAVASLEVLLDRAAVHASHRIDEAAPYLKNRFATSKIGSHSAAVQSAMAHLYSGSGSGSRDIHSLSPHISGLQDLRPG
jgi:hypothetical protein